MLHLSKLHHVAIICTDYNRAKKFYTEVLGLKIVQEIYRKDRDSWKLDLSVNGEYAIELFSFPDPPPRPTRPEAAGLRHLAFEVPDVEAVTEALKEKGIDVEPIRLDTFTQKKFTFIADPDHLPIEFYER
jgi:glyoxylase I family protein